MKWYAELLKLLAFLLDGLLQELLEDSVLVYASLIQALEVDELDPDDALDGLAGETAKLPVTILDYTAPNNYHESINAIFAFMNKHIYLTF